MTRWTCGANSGSKPPGKVRRIYELHNEALCYTPAHNKAALNHPVDHIHPDRVENRQNSASDLKLSFVLKVKKPITAEE